jgi:hypothetical protein
LAELIVIIRDEDNFRRFQKIPEGSPPKKTVRG